jgi:hypothetical protein
VGKVRPVQLLAHRQGDQSIKSEKVGNGNVMVKLHEFKHKNGLVVAAKHQKHGIGIHDPILRKDNHKKSGYYQFYFRNKPAEWLFKEHQLEEQFVDCDREELSAAVEHHFDECGYAPVSSNSMNEEENNIQNGKLARRIEQETEASDVLDDQGPLVPDTAKECIYCNGIGRINDKKCVECKGTGKPRPPSTEAFDTYAKSSPPPGYIFKDDADGNRRFP